MGMGVGGLLKEISLRGQPREAEARAPRAPYKIAGLILAAGRSTRMVKNKLLEDIGGEAVLTVTIQSALADVLSSVSVVTGHDRERVRALIPPGVAEVFNPAFASGMASSLKAGIAALPADADAVMVILGDMPAVRPTDIAEMIAAFDPVAGRGIVVPVYQGKRGHPVLFGRAYWQAILAAEGDQGARQAIIDNSDAVCEVPVDHPGVLFDADTPEALAMLRALMQT
jgi:molybdenum cofactor cytidylyltransferase